MMALLPYFLFYTAGLFAAFPASRAFLFPWALPVAALTAAAWSAARTRQFRRHHLVLFLLLLVWGGTAEWRDTHFRPGHHILHHIEDGRRAQVTGVVAEPPQYYPDRVRYYVDLESITYGERVIPVTGRARITLYEPEDTVRTGDRVRFLQVRLKRPRNFKNPGRFDYEHFMRTEGIDVMGGLSQAERLERLGPARVPALAEWRERSLRFMRGLFERGLDADKAALLRGMVLGEKEFLPESLQEAYRATGVAHLMAVSGLHIGFVAGATYFLVHPILWRLFLRYRPHWVYLGWTQKAAVLACFPPVLVYMCLIGGKVSALRAGAMVILFLAAVLVERERSLFNALLIAAFGILLWNPGAFLTPGFQLSFGAVFAILYFHRMLVNPAGDPIDRLGEQPWHRRLPGLRGDDRGLPAKAARFLYGTAFVSLAAILGTLPALVYHFNRVSLVGFFLNLLLVPLASLVIPAALLMALIGTVSGTLANALMPLLNGVLEVFVTVPVWAASLPHTSFYVPTPPAFWLVFYIALALGLPACLRRCRLQEKNPRKAPPSRFLSSPRWQAAGLALCGVGLVVWWMWPRFPDFDTGTLHVTLLDVGQGESVFVEFPNGETLLIDGGGFYKDALDVGQVVVGRFLWDRGYRRIDYLAATHSDHDHISGLLSIARLFEVGHFLDRDPPIPDPKIDLLRQTLLERGAKRLLLASGQSLDFGGARLTALHPGASFMKDSGRPAPRISNDLSWVLRLDYRGFRLLLTGDITERAEQYLAHNGARLDADILKIPHHGSRYSSSPEFLQAVGPDEALVSAGYVNPFGHPHPETLERYRGRNIRLWRTDRHGALHITTNGHGYRIETHEDL